MKKLNAQERVFEIVRLLVENHIEGLTNKELATLLKTTEANVCRDMAVFERYGYVARNSQYRWRLSPKFGGIAGHIMRAFQQAKLEIAREEAEYASAMQ